MKEYGVGEKRWCIVTVGSGGGHGATKNREGDRFTPVKGGGEMWVETSGVEEKGEEKEVPLGQGRRGHR